MRDEDILKHIPYGRKNAKSRFAIAAEIGITERAFRSAIERLNKSGEVLVIADQKAGGYFIPKLPEDRAYKEAYLRQGWSRVKEESKKLRAMAPERYARNSSKEGPGQMTLDLEGGANG